MFVWSVASVIPFRSGTSDIKRVSTPCLRVMSIAAQPLATSAELEDSKLLLSDLNQRHLAAVGPPSWG